MKCDALGSPEPQLYRIGRGDEARHRSRMPKLALFYRKNADNSTKAGETATLQSLKSGSSLTISSTNQAALRRPDLARAVQREHEEVEDVATDNAIFRLAQEEAPAKAEVEELDL